MEEDESHTHFQWLSKLVSRIHNSMTRSAPLLCLSFCHNVPNFEFNIENIDRNILSRGEYYSLVTSMITGCEYYSDHFTKPIDLFSNVLSSLNSIGYRPQIPCAPENLAAGFIADHINLCKCLEFIVVDKSLSIEKLLEDIRCVPRSFFVLRQYPTQLDGAIRLWLEKFPCNFDVPDISSEIQEDIDNGYHVAAVLSRVFPSKIDKNSVMKNKKDTNWKLVHDVLDQYDAFIPEKFPVEENLFICFIADLFYSTRIANKKFVRVGPPPQPVVSVHIKPKVLSNNTALPIVFKPSPRRAYHRSRLNRDDELELIQLYCAIEKNGFFFEVEDFKILIKNLVKMINFSDRSEQNFRKLWHLLQTKKQSTELYTNGRRFLSVLAGKNNSNINNNNTHINITISNNNNFNNNNFNNNNFNNINNNINNECNCNNCNNFNELRVSHRIALFARTMMNSDEIETRSRTAYSISTQTGSMTHSMSFIRETKSVKISCRQITEKKNEKAVQTESVNSKKQAENRFDTITYPYGETLTTNNALAVAKMRSRNYIEPVRKSRIEGIAYNYIRKNV